ncbi:MAG: queuosine precursor transporter [Alphaproteobacteria bacterium]|nr:queuosine precursor transporter [Alphaproteobacteria bacterium]
MKLKITTHDEEWSPKYFAVIVGIFCSLYMICTALNAKLISIFGVTLPGGILTFPLCCIITDLLTEVYGFNRTRQAIWTVLAGTILFAVFNEIAIALPYPSFWQNQAAFETIFSTTWRLALAGCLAWVAGEFANTYIMSKMKIVQNARNMPVRFIASTAAGQFFDSAVFIGVAFLGTMPLQNLVIMGFSVWITKILYETLFLPLSIPVTKWVKNLEGVEHFDRQKISLV